MEWWEKGPGHEIGRYLVPRLKNSWSYTSVSIICLRGLHRDSFFLIKLRSLLVRLGNVALYNCKRYFLKYNTLFLLATNVICLKVSITDPTSGTQVFFVLALLIVFSRTVT